MDTILSFGPATLMVILGVFLVFAAIIGGGLEVKELKIPRIGKTPRILTSGLGIMLMMCGACVGVISLWASMRQFNPPTPPTEIAKDYVPDTRYITTEKIQLPEIFTNTPECAKRGSKINC